MSVFLPFPPTITVVSLSIEIDAACPNEVNSTASNLFPNSSLITVAPVKIAKSVNISFLLSPNPGAFTAATLIVPRNLFTTRVANASPSKSSAMIIKGRPL